MEVEFIYPEGPVELSRQLNEIWCFPKRVSFRTEVWSPHFECHNGPTCHI